MTSLKPAPARLGPNAVPWWAAVCIICCAAFCSTHADEVVLKGGRKIQGKILEQNDKNVRILTATGSTLNLPRSIVQEILAVELSAEETAADLAMTRREYEKAMTLYHKAKEAGNPSKNIDEKIARVSEIVERKERERFEQLMNEAMKLNRAGSRPQARTLLDRITRDATEGGPYWTKARRAKAVTFYQDALALLDRVQYVPAITAIQQAVKTDPTFAHAYFQLARLTQNQMSDSRNANSFYAKGIAAAQDELNAPEDERKRLAEITPVEARITPEALILARYEHAELKYKLGHALEAAENFLALLGEHAEALTAAQRDRAIRNIVDAYTSVDLTQEFDQNKVLAQLDVALEKDPSASRAWFLKGLIYLNDDRTSEAIHSFTKAIEIGGNVPDRHLKRAEAYLRIKEPELARADLQKELAVHERYEVRVQLGEVFLMGADYDKAIEQYTAAIATEPDRAPALLGRARAYRFKALAGDQSKEKRSEILRLAEIDVNAVLLAKGDLLDAVLILGQINKDRELFDEAERRFTQVIDGLSEKKKLASQEKTALAQAYTERGDINLHHGNRNVARNDFLKALEIRDDFAPAYSKLGQTAEQMGDHAAARQNYLKAIEYDPKNADCELHIGILLHKYITKQPEYAKEAILHYEAYIEKGGKEPRVPDWIRECRAGVAKENEK